MKTYTLSAARTHLSVLVAEAARGETVVISKSGKPLVKMMALPEPPLTTGKRIGFLAGQVGVQGAAGLLRAWPIDHRIEAVARAIHAVQMSAYAQEARLLGVAMLPPLAGTVDGIRTSAASFLGVYVAGQLAGSVSVEADLEGRGLSIASLTVAPTFQRRGIAMTLMTELLQRHDANQFTVQTGAKNGPALHLYARLGFVEMRRWRVGPEALEIVELRRPSTLAS